jgi:UV DNA damage endonuclease
MIARLGFVASVLTENLSTSRTCRLRNVTPDRIRALIDQNLAALEAVIAFLVHHRIRLYRISSNLIPYASHPVNGVCWWEEYRDRLQRIGSRLRAHGIRVSTHPGQYTVLNSRAAPIVAAAIAELEYHAMLLDALGTGTGSKIVLHIGGLYAGTEQEAMDRFVAVAKALPRNVLRRLVVENDDRLFDAEEALSVAHRVGIPVVFDWLHHQANPCRAPISEVLPEIFATWKKEDGVPKVHLSSQASGKPPGAHASFVKAADVQAFLAVSPRRPFHCMLEAKQKDRALLRLRRDLLRRGIAEADL